MKRLMTGHRLEQENRAFAGTGGLSQENRGAGFLPAFRDLETGLVVLSRFANGQVAPLHLLDGLPEAWVTERAASGRILAVKDTVVAGFLREGRFYTRAEAAMAISSRKVA